MGRAWLGAGCDERLVGACAGAGGGGGLAGVGRPGAEAVAAAGRRGCGDMMRVTVLDRHLATAVVGMSLLALLALALIAGLTTVIDQLGDVGKGRFGIADAVRVALLTLPSAVYELFPMAVLLGSLLGLGALAANGELVAMRAAGWSVARMARAVALAGLAASVLVIALGEWVVPPAERLAVALKARAHVNRIINNKSNI